MVLAAADIKAIPISQLARATDWQAVAAETGLTFKGYSIRESDGAAATARIFDGTDNTGRLIAVIELATNASDHEFYGEAGVEAPEGIFVERLAGTYDISVLYQVI